MRTVYEGSISVEASDYTHPVEQDDDFVEVEIADLDVLVTRKTHLRLTLDYPFERPYEGIIIGDGGVTLRQIIDGIRRGFRVMYRGSSEEDIPNLANQPCGAQGRSPRRRGAKPSSSEPTASEARRSARRALGGVGGSGASALPDLN
jgi:hypothetical protein